MSGTSVTRVGEVSAAISVSRVILSSSGVPVVETGVISSIKRSSKGSLFVVVSLFTQAFLEFVSISLLTEILDEKRAVESDSSVPSEYLKSLFL